jgi:transcriptional regulator with XRE-family HTH domain
MGSESLFVDARRSSGLSQGALAARAGTSRPTLSAYEHGRKSPSLSTAERILAEAGFELTLRERVDFVARPGERGRPLMVPTALPRLSVEEALASVVLPLHLNWSAPGRRFDLRDRRDRARVYELVLREGTPGDVLGYVDGALLIDLWDDLVLPAAVRSAWASVVASSSKDTAA